MSPFFGDATAEIIEYLSLNQEWIALGEYKEEMLEKLFTEIEKYECIRKHIDLDEYKEEMFEKLFTEIKFVNKHQCKGIDIFDLNEWTRTKAEEQHIELSTSIIDQFNMCWYLTGKQLIYEEWDEMIKELIE
jgi:hypothetical protein